MGDLPKEAFEAVVFVLPLMDLGKQRLGDIGAAGLAVFFPGQVMAWVFVAPGATAGGLAAGALDGDQAGGHHGALGVERLLAGGEGLLDQGGMGGDFHGGIGVRGGVGNLDSINTYQSQGQKGVVRRKRWKGGARPERSAEAADGAFGLPAGQSEPGSCRLKGAKKPC